jgi:integrase
MAWIQKRGGVWWIGWRDKEGQQVRKSLRTPDKALAKAELERINSISVTASANAVTADYIEAITGRAPARKPTLAEFLQSWLAESAVETTAGTMLKYRQVVAEFTKAVNADSLPMRVDDVTPEPVTQFLADKAAKSSRETAQGFRKILRSIFIKAQDLGHVTRNPVPKASRRRASAIDEMQKRPFTLQEIRDLLARATPFWKYMVTAGFFTGQRMGDLVTLKRSNVHLAENVIRLTSRKTGKRVTIPMAKPLRSLVDSIWPKRDDDYFWPEQAGKYLTVGPSPFSQEFYGLMASVGLVAERGPKYRSKSVGRNATRPDATLGFHNLRHTFVTQVKMAGAPDSVARELAGHSSNLISSHYTHLPIATLEKAILQLPEVTK